MNFGLSARRQEGSESNLQYCICPLDSFSIFIEKFLTVLTNRGVARGTRNSIWNHIIRLYWSGNPKNYSTKILLSFLFSDEYLQMTGTLTWSTGKFAQRTKKTLGFLRIASAEKKVFRRGTLEICRLDAE